MPKKKIRFHDHVHGAIEFDTALFDDFVIQKSDGFPTYLFACVVDDHEMQITHVIRGDDHISNTPRQILIYEAFGWTPPEWAHLPLVFGSDRTPLSKRHAAVSITAYRKEGYLPEGIMNYLALLGWSPGGNKEFLPQEELVREFRLDQIHSTNACFDLEKLKWLNAEHIRLLSDSDYVDRVHQFFAAHHPELYANRQEQLSKVALLYKTRVRTFQELVEQADFFFRDEIKFDPKAVEKHLKDSTFREHMDHWRSTLAKEGDFSNPEALEVLLRKTAGKLGVDARVLIHSTRVSVSGRMVTPGLFETLVILGKELVLKRLQYAVEHFSELNNSR